LRHNRKYIGFEKEEKYYKIALKRMSLRRASPAVS
jgi:DNA modification methylase